MHARLFSSSILSCSAGLRPLVIGKGFFGGFFWTNSTIFASCRAGRSWKVAQYLSVKIGIGSSQNETLWPKSKGTPTYSLPRRFHALRRDLVQWRYLQER
jgi:hypothetical protein